MLLAQQEAQVWGYVSDWKHTQLFFFFLLTAEIYQLSNQALLEMVINSILVKRSCHDHHVEMHLKAKTKLNGNHKNL